MHIDVLTLFPGMFQGPLSESILGRAQKCGLFTIQLHHLRDFAENGYKQVDDAPYGGGAGMVMKVDVLVRAIESVMRGEGNVRKGGLNVLKFGSFLQSFFKSRTSTPFSPQIVHPPYRISLSPRGNRLTQEKVEELSKHERLLLLCGHYEGIDQRVIEGGWIDEEISIGDYVLTGGEIPAMVLIDAVARHIPGVLQKEESAREESFSLSLHRKREYPHYTRPEEFRGLKVPEVLLSGNHKEIEKWRREHLF